MENVRISSSLIRNHYGFRVWSVRHNIFMGNTHIGPRNVCIADTNAVVGSLPIFDLDFSTAYGIGQLLEIGFQCTNVKESEYWSELDISVRFEGTRLHSALMCTGTPFPRVP